MEQPPKTLTTEEILREEGVSLEYLHLPDLPEGSLGPKSAAKKLEDNLPPNRSFLVKNLVGWCKKYLLSPLILDSFGDSMQDHYDKRRPWEMKMSKKHGVQIANLFSQNRLGLNSRAPLYTYIEVLVQALEEAGAHSEEAEYIKGVYERLPKIADYHQLERVRKIEIVKQIDEEAKKLLDFLYADTTEIK